MTGRALAVAAAVSLFAAACLSISTPKPATPPVKRAFHPPNVKSIVVVVLENTSPQHARAQNFLGPLADTGVYFSNYSAVAHPSQPNYVAMVSGSFAGVRGDSRTRLNRPHLGRFLDSWTVYAEDYPGDTCNLSSTIKRYVRKHEPFASFADVQDSVDFCKAHITGFESFAADARNHRLPKFALVVPNLDHDGHDRPISEADQWLEKNFAPLTDDPLFRRDVLLIVTFDENDAKLSYIRRNANNLVYTVFWGDSVIPGRVDDVYDHYDLLRTIEEILQVKPMADGDGNAVVIGGIWR